MKPRDGVRMHHRAQVRPNEGLEQGELKLFLSFSWMLFGTFNPCILSCVFNTKSNKGLITEQCIPAPPL